MKVNVTVDRPIGYIHHGHAYVVYYGFVPGDIGGDMLEQDA